MNCMEIVIKWNEDAEKHEDCFVVKGVGNDGTKPFEIDLEVEPSNYVTLMIGKHAEEMSKMILRYLKEQGIDLGK